MPSDRQPRKPRTAKGGDTPDVASAMHSSGDFLTHPGMEASDDPAITGQGEMKLLAILNSLPTYIAQIDPQFNVTFMNERAMALTGGHVVSNAPADTHTPHPYWVNPDTHKPYLWDELPARRALREGHDIHDVRLATTHWGSAQTFLAQVTLMRDDQGAVTHATLMTVDITAQIQAEREARAQAQTLSRVIETIADGIIIYDAQNHIKQANPVARQILGWGEDEQIGIPETPLERYIAYELRYPNGKLYPLDMIPSTRALRGETVGPVECILRSPHANGGIRIVLAAAPLNDPVTNAITGAVVTFHDTSERYRLERMREQFILAASHELRTPLTSLVLAAHVMEKRTAMVPEAAAMGQFVLDINAQIARMKHLVDNLLDFTELIRGQLRIQHQQCNLTEVIREAVELLRATLRCNIPFAYTAPLWMRGDPERLGRVFETIIAYGCAASSEQHPVQLAVDREKSSTEGIARITIQTAMTPFVPPPQDVMDRFVTETLFDPYEPGSLLGEGLYLISSIIEMHGGQIEINAIPGKERRFTIRLPLLQ
jgi:PAS domain S-box-containing protein